MRYDLYGFVCVMILILADPPNTALGGPNTANDGTSLRDARSDCNGNGVPDGDELHPLDGSALYFDGAGDYVDPGASTVLAELGQGNFTIEAWIRTTDPGHSVLVGNAGDASALYNFVIRGNDEGGVTRLRLKDGSTSYTCTGSVSVNDGVWHHVAVSRWRNGGGTILLYVDGEASGACSCGGLGDEAFTADNPTLIGRDVNSSPAQFEGAMDELRVWNMGRSLSDVQADMYRVLDGDEEGLVAYWRFDEGTGSVAYDSAGDSDGTLVGSARWAPYGYDWNNNGVLDECDPIIDGVIYVDDDATSGLNDGLSWTNAFEDLQDALTFAAHESRVTEIRVAGGTYKPGTDQDDSFELQDDLALRGGYRGLAGGGDPNDRDIDAFESILSGDIGVSGDPDDNCLHVVVCETEDTSPLIEGFTITEGNAYEERGGGVYIEDASPTIAKCKFIANRAAHGGGLCSYGECGAPTIVDSTFTGNSASYIGGGLGCYGSDLTIVNCTFSGNSATSDGGGMHIWVVAYVKLMNCTFTGNSATGNGGGLYQDMAYPTLVNCTLIGNSAGSRGGGCYSKYDIFGNLQCKNCIIWGNTAGSASQVYGADVFYSCVQGGAYGEGNIRVDPLFVDADGPDGIYGTADDDVHLLEGSPCINAGDNGAIPEGVTIDFEGDDRIQHCRVDMGADETPYFEDCNSNEVSDECDIASGASTDENGNGVPDECEMFGDCDHDLDVDLDDWSAMLNCLSGPGAGLGNDCDCFDSDGDSDVDLADFALFQAQFTGPQQ